MAIAEQNSNFDTDYEEQSAKLYEVYRKQVEHENNLYNQKRLNWLILMQGILYATMGLLLQAKHEPNATSSSGSIVLIIAVVCLLGIAVAMICQQLLNNSGSALSWLKANWNRIKAEEKFQASSFLRNFPHVSGAEGVDLRSSNPLLRSRYIPTAFAIGWLGVGSVLLSDLFLFH